ncbi:MAG TPA: hypothetical protein DC047_18815 [Blastocatellia bacterium]|nr:hypothetical protein [Blastocatellia bacterium]
MSHANPASARAFIFHPLIVLSLSLIGAALYALYATLRFPSDSLWGQYFYVTPIVVPFAAFLFDRAARRRQITAFQSIVDVLVVGTAMWRVIGHVPYISGHALFLTYALLSTRSRVAQVTAAAVMLQVVCLKYIVWGDWITSTNGIAIGVLAALATMWLGAKSEVELESTKATSKQGNEPDSQSASLLSIR